MYLPEQWLVRRRIDNGAARARGDYAFPPEHVTADGVEMHEKLIERAHVVGAFECYLCGGSLDSDDQWHLDHVVPLVLRGPHAVDNLEAACVGCNLTKGEISLEEFLGPKLYAEFIAGAGPPPFIAMRSRPVAELWSRSHDVARRFARRPREVPHVSWSDNWFDPRTRTYGLDAEIAKILRSQPDPARALPVRDLAPLVGMKNYTSLQDNYWLRCMGFNDRTGKENYHDNRLHPSPLVIPVRCGGPRRGLPAFRLRGGAPLAGGPQPQRLVDWTGQLDLPVKASGRWPDQDDLT